MEKETYEPPKEFTYKNVVYWEPCSKELRTANKGRPLLHKAKLFLENGCIKVSNSGFVCLPLKGYNNTTYTINEYKNHLECNCQGYQNKLKKGEIPTCSHVIAVRQWKYINNDK